MVGSYNFHVACFWRVDSFISRICFGPLYLHDILNSMRVLGLSSFYHDSGAALVIDGEIISAAQEERFSRLKHDSRFPKNALKYCLEEAELSLDQIDNVVFYDKPFLKFERLLETYLATVPKGFTSFKKAMPIWIKEKLFQKSLIKNKLKEIEPNFDWENKLLFSEHHLSHAASAFFPSPFDEALVLTMDGVGEWATTSVAVGKSNNLNINREINFPHSIGLLYSAFTYYIGFKVNSGEYKLMGLAPYGEPKFKDLILKEIVDLKEDGTFWLNQNYFDYCTGLKMTSSKFNDLMGGSPRKEEEEILQRHMDIAASIQSVTEEIILRLTRSLAKDFNCPNLCLAGGVALNCVANGKLIKDGSFKNIWIQPAAGDAGGALGAALTGYYVFSDKQRITMKEKSDHMKGSYLGPEFEQKEIEGRLRELGAKFTVVSDSILIKNIAQELAKEKAIGWFQGRMEFGPRALGARSIIADPRSNLMQKNLNLKVKFRESFRPFAPSILAEDLKDWFDLSVSSPYMMIVSNINERLKKALQKDQKEYTGFSRLNIDRSEIPAVTHVDYSARIQTVHKETNPRFYSLINEFKLITGCPIVVNTSFNIRGEPIVATPEDAFRCFMGTDLDILSIGNCVLFKNEQKDSLKHDYKNSFVLD